MAEAIITRRGTNGAKYNVKEITVTGDATDELDSTFGTNGVGCGHFNDDSGYVYLNIKFNHSMYDGDKVSFSTGTLPSGVEIRLGAFTVYGTDVGTMLSGIKSDVSISVRIKRFSGSSNAFEITVSVTEV